MKYFTLPKNYLFLLFPICFLNISCEESCFPSQDSTKLRICMKEGRIQCPGNVNDCYLNMHDFYADAWDHMRDSLGDADFQTYLEKDTLITGIFVNLTGGGEDELPECNLPPLPIIGGNTSIYERNNNVLFSSIIPVMESKKGKFMPHGDLLYYRPEEPDQKNRITITKFDYSPFRTTGAYEYIKDYYQSNIDQYEIDTGKELAFIEDKIVLIGGGNLTLSANYFWVKHGGDLKTYIIEMSPSSFLRIRLWSSETTDIDLTDQIEFYK